MLVVAFALARRTSAAPARKTSAALAHSTMLTLAISVACGGSALEATSPSADPHENSSGGCANQSACQAECDSGNAAACGKLGRMFETGDGAPQDYDRAAANYEKACDAGDHESCAHLAMMYDIGLAVEEDPQKAAELYAKACTNGNRWACKRGEQLDR